MWDTWIGGWRGGGSGVFGHMWRSEGGREWGRQSGGGQWQGRCGRWGGGGAGKPRHTEEEVRPVVHILGEGQRQWVGRSRRFAEIAMNHRAREGGRVARQRVQLANQRRWHTCTNHPLSWQERNPAALARPSRNSPLSQEKGVAARTTPVAPLEGFSRTYTDDADATRVGHSGRQPRAGGDVHPGQHDRVLDPEQLSERRVDS